jgi:hypothetical protein
MTEGSYYHLGDRLPAGTARPAKKPILRAQMTALARRFYGPELPAGQHRSLAADILRVRRRASGR